MKAALFRRIFLVLIVLTGTIAAASPVAVDAERISLLEHGALYFDRESHDPAWVMAHAPFEPSQTERINLGFDADTTVWVRLQLDNPTASPLSRIIEVDNPLLEHVAFYDADATRPQMGGLLHHQGTMALTPAFEVLLPPQTASTVTLALSNATTSLKFGLMLHTPEAFAREQIERRLTIVLLAGMIASLMLYSVLLYRFSRERSYLYFAVYLFALLFQQLTYVGLLPALLPEAWTQIDNVMVVPKVALMIVTALFYARAFLKTRRHPRVDRIYRVFLLVSLLQIPLLGTPLFYLPEGIVLTGFLFVVFNTAAGIHIYRKGNKQARFFIAGWGVSLVGYILMIVDALGIWSVMHQIPSLMLWATLAEALMLMLAFADRITIVQRQKRELDHRLMRELTERKALVETEVEVRTGELATALDAKRLLLRELHHRVKNNLQIILSIIRLQRQRQEAPQSRASFLQLESRINAISKSHELLCQNDISETVDMQEYISGLCRDIERSLSQERIAFSIESGIRMAMREAVYVGLIVNELVSNAIKHAGGDAITVRLQPEADGMVALQIGDNGGGCGSEPPRTGALGLQLVRTLVEEQLEGEMRTRHADGCTFDIRFAYE